MPQRDVDVADMQCWVFRLAQVKWHKSALECLELFERFDVFGYIDELYEMLHLSGYQAALSEIEAMMRAQGASL